MKKKDMIKLSKIISDEVNKVVNDPLKITGLSGMYGTKPGIDINEVIDYIEYDSEISNRFYKFTCNIIKLKDKINLHISDDSITINGSLDGKPNPNGYPYASFSFGGSSDDYLDIQINKDGFRISRGYASKINYKDDTMLGKLKKELKERNKSASKDSIIEMIDDIMVKTNLSRDHNLYEILE